MTGVPKRTRCVCRWHKRQPSLLEGNSGYWVSSTALVVQHILNKREERERGWGEKRKERKKKGREKEKKEGRREWGRGVGSEWGRKEEGKQQMIVDKFMEINSKGRIAEGSRSRSTAWPLIRALTPSRLWRTLSLPAQWVSHCWCTALIWEAFLLRDMSFLALSLKCSQVWHSPWQMYYSYALADSKPIASPRLSGLFDVQECVSFESMSLLEYHPRR